MFIYNYKTNQDINLNISNTTPNFGRILNIKLSSSPLFSLVNYENTEGEKETI